MGSWLRNIQGQLSELANEVMNEANDVLNEAREEVADPDTELQVAKKKCAEAEKMLAIESAKVKSLENEKGLLEQQLYDTNVEIDAVSEKFTGMVKQRDEEIKKLRVQIEQMNESGWNDGPSEGSDDVSNQQIADLKKEIAHWKSLVNENGGTSLRSENMITLTEFEKKMDELRQKKESEIHAIIETHADSIVELREMYEEKLQAMQVLQYNASSSTSNADTLDAVLLEKEDLLESKKKLEEMVRSKTSTNGSDIGERPVMVELGSRDELTDERIHQVEAELERVRLEKEEMAEMNNKVVESLKNQNQELAQAYNDLNEEFEAFKREHVVVETRNHDLNNRIDSMKASLIEYEERYELCKRENRETVAKLDKLSADFDRLRGGIANVNAKRENCDSMMNDEVEKLRNALDESRSERERLREDVQRFQVAVGEIDEDLEKLRESNRRLLGENEVLTQNLAGYETTMRDIISSSEKDIGEFREQFKSIQERHAEEREAVINENKALRDQIESMKQQNEYAMDESRLLKEVNEKLKVKSENEEVKTQLLEQKAELIDALRKEISEELAATKQQIEDLKKELDEEKQKNSEREKNVEKDEACSSAELEEKLEKNPDDMTIEEREIVLLRSQLTEALYANGEKSEECEDLQNQKRNLEKEIEIRQNCVDEMIAQTNTLQMQQNNLTRENSELKNEIMSRVRDYVRLENQLTRERENTEEMAKVVKSLEGIILDGSKEMEEENGDVVDEENGESNGSLKVEGLKQNSHKMRKYIEELKLKNEQQAAELLVLKGEMESSNKQSADTQERLEKELREAEEVDRGLLEGIEKRVIMMEESLAEKVRQLEESKGNCVKLTSQVEELKSKIVELESAENAKCPEVNSEEICELRSSLATLTLENEELKKKNSGENENSEVNSQENELQSNVNSLTTENEELKKALVAKHEESVEYYRQLEQCIARNQQVEAQLVEMSKSLEEANSRMAESSELLEKRGRELERLKQHLMIVEQTSTSEAVEAEQRETELRARIKDLEARGTAVEEGANESTQHYQIQIASLTSKLESSETSRKEIQNRYESEIKAREQTQEALTSLQNVVRELSIDHDRDAAASSHRNLELQTQINTLNSEISTIRDELDRQSIGRQAAEDEIVRMNMQIESKQKIIEDLEVQIEELRAPSKSGASDSYRIDDTTLRQLFLSYFLAEPSKRADIAMLLASILEYPADEMEKFRHAVRQSFGQQSGGSKSAQQSSSLMEQFIRFLEVESESAKTAPHLPIRSQKDPPPKIILESNKPSDNQPSQPASTSSSVVALDSLLR